jgi:hypothetical protein
MPGPQVPGARADGARYKNTYRAVDPMPQDAAPRIVRLVLLRVISVPQEPALRTGHVWSASG